MEQSSKEQPMTKITYFHEESWDWECDCGCMNFEEINPGLLCGICCDRCGVFYSKDEIQEG